MFDGSLELIGRSLFAIAICPFFTLLSSCMFVHVRKPRTKTASRLFAHLTLRCRSTPSNMCGGCVPSTLAIFNTLFALSMWCVLLTWFSSTSSQYALAPDNDNAFDDDYYREQAPFISSALVAAAVLFMVRFLSAVAQAYLLALP